MDVIPAACRYVQLLSYKSAVIGTNVILYLGLLFLPFIIVIDP